MHKPIPIRGCTALMAPQYFGSIVYYAALNCYERVAIDCGMRYDKRFKSTHRCEIADTRGRLSLTVPIAKPQAWGLGWNQIQVSPHGEWWSDHIISLESAYGRTPFFEFYIDRFKPWIANRAMSVAEMDRGIDMALRQALGIEARVDYIDDESALEGEVVDLRRGGLQNISIVPYYQVRADRLGFVPGLSVVDLLFNLGAEAPLILAQMANKYY